MSWYFIVPKNTEGFLPRVHISSITEFSLVLVWGFVLALTFFFLMLVYSNIEWSMWAKEVQFFLAFICLKYLRLLRFQLPKASESWWLSTGKNVNWELKYYEKSQSCKGYLSSFVMKKKGHRRSPYLLSRDSARDSESVLNFKLSCLIYFLFFNREKCNSQGHLEMKSWQCLIGAVPLSEKFCEKKICYVFSTFHSSPTIYLIF